MHTAGEVASRGVGEAWPLPSTSLGCLGSPQLQKREARSLAETDS